MAACSTLLQWTLVRCDTGSNALEPPVMLLLLPCRFPATASKKDTSFYCKFNDKTLQSYSAIMHFTGALASLVAGYVTQRFGRTASMVVAGTAYIAGSILQVSAPVSLHS